MDGERFVVTAFMRFWNFKNTEPDESGYYERRRQWLRVKLVLFAVAFGLVLSSSAIAQTPKLLIALSS